MSTFGKVLLFLNLLAAGGTSTIKIVDAAKGNLDKLTIIYEWDAGTESWKVFFPDAGAGASTLDSFSPGHVYWVFAKVPFTIGLPR